MTIPYLAIFCTLPCSNTLPENKKKKSQKFGFCTFKQNLLQIEKPSLYKERKKKVSSFLRKKVLWLFISL